MPRRRGILGTKEQEVEMGATFVPPSEGRSLWALGELVTCKTRSEQTGGAYSLFEVTTRPGTGPPPHVHHREDESFYVLQGKFRFVVEDGTIRAGTGSLIYVPKGTLHAHENVGESSGRMLATQTPGGLYEDFLEEAGKQADGDAARLAVFEDRPGEANIIAIAARYGIEIPPVAQGGRA